MTKAALITQCLQNDFVRPIGRYDPLPNLLHIGFEEARRLMGDTPDQGPVAHIIDWAYRQSADQLHLIHVRDWHVADDPLQRSHLEQFGQHCLCDTEGAKFSFDIPEHSENNPTIINSLTLNDFRDSQLDEVLETIITDQVRIGLIGVWTEAKVSFLAYELRTRYPNSEIAVCSALTASSSRNNHFVALSQMNKLLGIRIIPSMGEFIEYLGGNTENLPLLGVSETKPSLSISESLSPQEDDMKLMRYLFRDCDAVQFKTLAGGFSGNLVLGSESVDFERRQQVPHVVKIGPRELIGQERIAFEKIESVLGNAAPRIVDFADFGTRGAIKYRYASMGGVFSATFQKLYMTGMPMTKVKKVLRTVFEEQLGRLYMGAEREVSDLLEYYGFSSRFSTSVRTRVEQLIGAKADQEILTLPGNVEVPNLCKFYEEELDQLPRHKGKSWYFSYIHGDLNGANIILDDNRNVWLIDFFHTHRGHVLKDLIKLENDVLYIFTPMNSEAEFKEACLLSDLLLSVGDLSRALPKPDEFGITSPALLRAYDTIACLRSFYPNLIKTDRDPLQFLIAQLRYAVHTLGFDECNTWQRLWALYTSAKCAEQIKQRLNRLGPLRVDWLSVEGAEKVGLTILPGRKDYDRDLTDDIADLHQQGVTHIACLVPDEELAHFGVAELLTAFNNAGFKTYHLPIVDQKTCNPDQAQSLISWMNTALAENDQNKVLIHCVAGLGRSGMMAAAYLKSTGLDTEAAIAGVRSARSSRAIESVEQEDFVKDIKLPL